MKNILIIDSSPRKKDSISRKVSEEILKKILQTYPKSNIVIEDLAQNLPSHLNHKQLQSFFIPADQLNEKHKECLLDSDRYINQIRKADILIISFPVWNFSIPSNLKAWIDQIVRQGQTFHYTQEGKPIGLLQGKTVFLAVARGGIYSRDFDNNPKNLFDFSVVYMKTILGYIGITDVREVVAEGIAIPDLKKSALLKAIESITTNGI